MRPKERKGTGELPGRAEAVVVGGGVMGASTLYHLARRGLTDAVLVEREPFLGAMSTGQCAGGIRHQFASEINVRFSLASIAMLERFEEEPGHEIGLRFDGYLILLSDPSDVERFRAAIELQHRLGVMTRWLEPEEIADMVPVLNLDGVRAGTFYERDGLCDPSSVVQGYARGARRMGAKVFTGAEVRDISRDGPAFRVVTEQGTISTPVVVDAAGAWAPEIARGIGIDIPIAPIRRQMLVTTPLPAVPPDFPFVIFFDESLYFHREGRGLLTGRSNPEETPGFRLDVDQDWELVHLEAAVRRLPLLENAGVLSRWAGLYEVTPDAHPILGRIATVDGFFVMAGFSGHGFMHGPIAGLLMAEEILDGAAHTIDIQPFRYERFVSDRLDPEYNVI